MIKLSEILKAVNLKLAEKFSTISIDSKDLSEEFNRPSFRTELDGLKTSAFMTTHKEREFTIRIYYFPKDEKKGRLERLKIAEGIEEIFLNTLWVTNSFAIPIDEINFVETDGVLIASFDSYTMEEIENDITSEMMEELEYRR